MKILFLFLLSISFLNAKFTTLSTSQVQEAIKNNIVIIDIRRDDEYKKFGVIKTSHKLTFFNKHGKYDIDAWLGKFTKIITNKNQKFILVCAHANRTKVVGKMLSNHLGYQDVNELNGGINYGWIDKGLKTEAQK